MSSYAIDSESEQIVVVTLTGEVRFDTVIALLDELEDMGRRRRELTVLVDETEASPGLVGASEIRRMVEHWMAQSFGGEDADGHLGVFKVREAATEWLLEAGTSTLH